MKFIANNKKFKTKKLSEKEIILKDDFKNNNIEKIIDILKGIIDIKIDDIIIIRNKLGEQIKKIKKEKKKDKKRTKTFKTLLRKKIKRSRN